MVEKNADPETTLLAYLRRKCILTLEWGWGRGAVGTHSLGLCHFLVTVRGREEWETEPWSRAPDPCISVVALSLSSWVTPGKSFQLSR